MENRISENFNLERATNNVLKLKQDVGKGIIAIGEWLQIVKANLSHKEFLDWLRAEVKIHRSTAYRYIKVSQQVDYQTLEKLGPSKIYEIIEKPGLSEEERKELYDRAESMTKRELQEELDTPKSKQSESINDGPNIPPEVDSLIDEGIDFIERAEKMSFTHLADNWKQFVRSQLSMISDVVKKIADNV